MLWRTLHRKITGLFPFRCTGVPSYRRGMAVFDIIRKGTADVERDEVEADAYQQEGPMTTFFALADDRRVIDCWSTRVASYRTADIVTVRRRDAALSLRAVG